MTASAPARTIPPTIVGERGELLRIPLEQLTESPWNPRKHFDPAKLAETAESLKSNGQLTPITVRVKKGPFSQGQHASYEIGAGHRRFRAAKLAGLTSLLAVVLPLDDVAFLELLTVENKQREDVAPLDEAAGFKLLMEKARYDVARLAERIGLSTKYVYDRLKLLQLVPEAKKYLEDGTITAGHAILLARLTPSDQKRVIGNPNRINRYGYNDGTGLFQSEFAEDDPDQPGLELKQPVKARSVRELATWINDHVRFDPATNDLPNLFPAAAAGLAEAKDDDLNPVYITYDHQLKHDAKDHKVRTYGMMSWRRADGKEKSKTCAWSRIGIVAAGRDRGDVFRVCVNRDKCEVHFNASVRAKKQRAADVNKYAPVKEDEDSGYGDAWERRDAADRAKRKVAEARFAKAAPALLTALGKALDAQAVSPTSALGRFFLDQLDLPRVDRKHEQYQPGGKTAEAMIRRAVFAGLSWHVVDIYDGGKTCFNEFKLFGVDARKILDEVAPEEKPAPKAPAKKKGGRK